MNVMGNGAAILPHTGPPFRPHGEGHRGSVSQVGRRAVTRQKITVTALAREADIDRKTFYLHYGTVDAVADALLKQEAERIVEVLREESFFERGTIDATEFFSRLSVTIAPDLARTRRMAKHVSRRHRPEQDRRAAAPRRSSKTTGSGWPIWGLTWAIAWRSTRRGCWRSIGAGWLVDSEIPLEDISSVANAAAFYGIKGILGEGQAAAREAEGGSAQEGQ